jgi:Protein of unknown function (DUF3551)
MRARACIIVSLGAILIAAPAWAAGGRYDPAYPVCMEIYDQSGSRIDCFFTSMEQCKLGSTAMAGSCFNNPYYVQPAPEAATAPQTEPAPVKPAKSAKSAKSTRSPPSPQPAQPQQR